MHGQLGGLAAATAGHARHVGVQPCLELEQVQVPPRAAQPVMHGLRGRSAGRTAQQRPQTTDFEVDALGRNVQLDSLHRPRRLQTQRAGEQRLHLNAQSRSPGSCPLDMWTASNAACPHAHRAQRQPPPLSVGFHTKRRGAKRIPRPRKKPRKSLTVRGILDFGGASGTRTPDLRIMIPSL
jgi:hypothetical protein